MNKRGLSTRKKVTTPAAFEQWDWGKSLSKNCIDNLAPATHQVMQVLQNNPSPYEIQAAEIVYDTADHTKDNMGLTTWKNAPDGRILKSDT